MSGRSERWTSPAAWIAASASASAAASTRAAASGSGPCAAISSVTVTPATKGEATQGVFRVGIHVEDRRHRPGRQSGGRHCAVPQRHSVLRVLGEEGGRGAHRERAAVRADGEIPRIHDGGRERGGDVVAAERACGGERFDHHEVGNFGSTEPITRTARSHIPSAGLPG